MIYRKSKIDKKLTYKMYDLIDFENGINKDNDAKVTALVNNAVCYNFSCKNGALSSGMGIGQLNIKYDLDDVEKIKIVTPPTSPELLTIWNYENYFADADPLFRWLVFYGADKYIYIHYLFINNTTIGKYSEMIQFDDVPKFFNYEIDGEPVFIFITKEGEMKAVNAITKVTRTITNAPNINSYCIHNKRMYVTDINKKNQVWYSHEDDPTNWTMNGEDAGSIEFKDVRGNCLKVISFDDNVYVFREFGISRITAHKDQEEPEVENLYLSSNCIYGDTVCVCGDKILFMTTDGFYSFNGSSVSKIDLNSNNLLSKITSCLCAEYHDNAYFLACKVNFNDNFSFGCEQYSATYKTNALFKLDLLTNELSILRGVDIRYMKAIHDINNDFLSMVIDDNGTKKIAMLTDNGKIFDTNTTKIFQTTPTDFGLPNKKKLFKKMYINSQSQIHLTLFVDDQQFDYEIYPSNETFEFSPNVKGYTLSVNITTSFTNPKISNMKMLVGCL